jgi:6-phosphofructokinase 2
MTDILTVTMNPAVDISTSTDHVLPTHKIRCGISQRHPGGGGINVARVIHRLKGDCLALYPAGGIYGRLLQQLLDEEGINGRCIRVAGETRESFSVKETSTGQEFRFVLPGPDLSAMECQSVLDFIADLKTLPRYVVISGSLPLGVPVDFYARLARLAKANGSRVVLDTSGPALASALQEGVFLAKPSLRELRDLVGEPLETEFEWKHAAEQLVLQGRAQVIVLSLGEGGAWLVSKEGAFFAPALPVTVISAIGAGDSFVGAMVWALSRGLDLRESFRYGVAAGSAALLSGGTGLCHSEDVDRLLGDVKLVS